MLRLRKWADESPGCHCATSHRTARADAIAKIGIACGHLGWHLDRASPNLFEHRIHLAGNLTAPRSRQRAVPQGRRENQETAGAATARETVFAHAAGIADLLVSLQCAWDIISAARLLPEEPAASSWAWTATVVQRWTSAGRLDFINFGQQYLSRRAAHEARSNPLHQDTHARNGAIEVCYRKLLVLGTAVQNDPESS